MGLASAPHLLLIFGTVQRPAACEQLKSHDAHRPAVHGRVRQRSVPAAVQRRNKLRRGVREGEGHRHGSPDGGGVVKVSEHPAVDLPEVDDVRRLHIAVDVIRSMNIAQAG